MTDIMTPYYKVWSTHGTRPEGGNATHLSREYGGQPLCGTPILVGGTSDTVDPRTPQEGTDCLRCQRIVVSAGAASP